MFNLKFYKENGIWYADIPQHTKEENEMVMGSDTFLELYSTDGKTCNVKFEVEEPESYIMKLTRGEHDWDGAYYTVEGNCANNMEIWICNVTHTVCGEHPEYIFITNIS